MRRAKSREEKDKADSLAKNEKEINRRETH